MSDLNTMMLDQARSGLQRELDDAVTNGDTDAARRASEKLANLAVSSAPKAPAITQEAIRAELDKQPWFGIDPRKSAKAVELGKTMDPKKFASAAAFAEALIKAVDADFPAPRTKPEAGEEGDDAGGEEGDDEEDDDAEADTAKPAKKPKRSDAPGEGDAGGARPQRRTAGPWTKLADAPANVQKEINRSADKFVGSSATKESKAAFIARALESHYQIAQRAKGKK